MIPRPVVVRHADGSWTETITLDGGGKVITSEHDPTGRITSTITTVRADDGTVTTTVWTDPGTDDEEIRGTTTFPDGTGARFRVTDDGTRVTHYELPDRVTVTEVHPDGTTHVRVMTNDGHTSVTRVWLIDTRTGRPIGDTYETRTVPDPDNRRTYVTDVTNHPDGSKMIREQVWDEHGNLLQEDVTHEPPPKTPATQKFSPPEGSEQQFVVGGGGGSGGKSHVFGAGSGYVTVHYTDWWMHTDEGEIYLGTDMTFQTAEGNSWP